MDFEFEKIKAITFYDSNNQPIGSVGIIDINDVETAAYSAMMDVFSVEEFEKIAYFKTETRYLVIK